MWNICDLMSRLRKIATIANKNKHNAIELLPKLSPELYIGGVILYSLSGKEANGG